MAKAKEHYKIKNEEKKVYGDIKKMTEKEIAEVKALVDLGYEFIDRKTRAVSTASKRDKQYYKGKLTEEQYKEFDEMCKDSKKGFFKARKWAEEQLAK